MRASGAPHRTADATVVSAPRDRALRLEDGALSLGVLRMIRQVSAAVSFREGHQLLRKLAGVEISAKQVERYAEVLGREIVQDERQGVEAETPSAPTNVSWH